MLGWKFSIEVKEKKNWPLKRDLQENISYITNGTEKKTANKPNQ